MKEYSDILLSEGQNITDEKILNHILDGLVVVMLNYRLESKFHKLTLQDAQYQS